MLEKCVEPASGDVAESCGQSVLKPGTSYEKRSAMRLAKVHKRREDGVEIGFDNANRGAQLQNQPGIERVLTGGAASGRSAKHRASCVQRLR